MAVAQLSELIALERGYPHAKARQIKIAAVLHDVGKQKIADSLRNKPGKLTAREFEIMKTHTALGAQMLKNVQGELGEIARTTALMHHEWWDGSKSYWGARARDLPEYVSMVSLCDVFTALVTERPYKGAWQPDEAAAYIQNQAGTQFGPELAKLFIGLVRNDSRVPAIFTGGLK